MRISPLLGEALKGETAQMQMVRRRCEGLQFPVSKAVGRVRRGSGEGLGVAAASTLGLEEGGQPWVQDDGRKASGARQGDRSSSSRGAGPSPSPAIRGTWQLWRTLGGLSLLERDRRKEWASRPCGQLTLTRGQWVKAHGAAWPEVPGAERGGAGESKGCVSSTSTQTGFRQCWWDSGCVIPVREELGLFAISSF